LLCELSQSVVCYRYVAKITYCNYIFTDLNFFYVFAIWKNNEFSLDLQNSNFFQAAQGAHHYQEGFREEDGAQGPDQRALQGQPDSC
jgi:hypothetical protein